MRIAQVSGSSGAGLVVAIHEQPSVSDLETFLTERGSSDRAIEAPQSWITVDTEYDGTNFVQPTPPTTPPATPPTPEAVRAELDQLRENAVAEYVAKWGDLSKREMWQPLKQEIKELALITSAVDVVVGVYPSIVGFLQGSGVADPSPQQIYDTAAALRAHQSAHLKELRRTEVLRETILNAYVAEPEADRLAWLATQTIEQRWSVAYGA